MPSDVIRSPVELTFDRGTLLLRGLPSRDGWTFDARVGCLRTHAIHYAAERRDLLRDVHVRLFDRVRVPPRVAWPRLELPRLHAAQTQALDAWERGNGRGVIVMPTGTGKTEVALAAMARARVATLVVAPVRDLMHQWHRRILRGLGCDAGIVGDSIFNPQPVTVTTYDSAYARMPELGDRFGLVIFDEAHHLPGRCYREAAMFCAAPMRLGLTATPDRADGRHVDLDALIGPIVYRQEIAEARGGALADYEVVRVPVNLSDAEQQTYDGASDTIRTFIIRRQQELREQTAPGFKPPAYTWQDLCAESGADPGARLAQKAFHLRKSIEDRAADKLRVLEDLFRLHAGERVIVFAGSNAMAIDVSRRFLVPTLLSHSRKRERREVLERFADGRFPVLVANQVLDEGVDVPAAKVAVVIGGLASTRQAKQRLGRILRRSGDARATLYEIVCQGTGDEERSRKRRRSDAYDRVKRRRM
ncbi:MAG: DEAD/DEAH box helicase family protein [Tepidisphaeraceae bacterium]